MSDTITVLNKEELLDKANHLPLTPGVYIMKDKRGNVIYVGKSKHLKNRVSQYFQNSEKNTKTAHMVASVANFDFMVCHTEIEALSLENTLIKQYVPRYNIRLKDAKSYPYLKVTADEYPAIRFTRKRENDKARYFGPFSGVSTAFSILHLLQKALGIPSCTRRFPEDIGKGRPCLYYQLKQCCGVCTGGCTKEEYRALMDRAVEVLNGQTQIVTDKLTKEMMDFADNENFEAAAKARDTIRALEALRKTQQVVAAPGTEHDVIGLYEDDYASCVYILYVRDGRVRDHVSYLFGAGQITGASEMGSFICDFYRQNAYIPSKILLSFDMDEEESATVNQFLTRLSVRKTEVFTPRRGDLKRLCDLAVENAKESVREYKRQSEKDSEVLLRLAELLRLESYPSRIESYDISNLGTEYITAGMIVCEDGKFNKSDYRVFRVKSVVDTTDDYKSMREVLERRLTHLQDEKGSFSKYPDLILLDGGKGHVHVVRELMQEMGLEIPVFGMVKDDFHKTRALCTDEEEISIAREQNVFTLIYKIQDEVHRFSVSQMDSAKRKTLRHSVLEKINGIGPAKAKQILREMKTLSAVKQASAEELQRIKGVSASDAQAVYSYYHKNGEKETK